MDYVGFLRSIGSLPLNLVLMGVIWYLYRELTRVREDLFERYHKQMEDQIHTLTLINEQLDKK